MKMISTISYVAAAVVGYMEVVPDGCVVINRSSFVPNPIARSIMTPFIVSKAVSVHERRPLTRRATTSHTDAVQQFHTQCPSHLIHSPSSPLLSNSVITLSNSFGPALISQLLQWPLDHWNIPHLARSAQTIRICSLAGILLLDRRNHSSEYI